jgi:hypothetical protein
MIEIVVRISPVSAGKILTANLGGFEGGTRVAGEAQLVLNAAGFSTPGYSLVSRASGEGHVSRASGT